jgi:lysophospholipase L1-like esterase
MINEGMKIIGVIFFLTVSVSSCEVVSTKLFGGGGLKLKNKKVVFTGDSITFSEGWSTPLCSHFFATQINQAKNGQVLEYMEQFHTCNGTSQFDSKQIPTFDKTYGVLFIAIGINDIGFNNGTTTPEKFYNTFISELRYIKKEKKWPSKRIILLTPYFMTVSGAGLYPGIPNCGVIQPASENRRDQFEEKVRDVASINRIRLIDVSKWFRIQAEPAALLVDGVHLTPDGYTKMTEYIISMLEKWN